MSDVDDEGDDWFAPPTVNTEWRDGTLYVAGEIDAVSCSFLRSALAEHEGPTLTVHFGGVDFCDSSCLQCLLDIVRAGRQLTLLHPTPQVARVLAIVIGTGIEGLTIEP